MFFIAVPPGEGGHRIGLLLAVCLGFAPHASAQPANFATEAPPPPAGAKPYVADSRPEDGRHLALTFEKLDADLDPPRPLLIWALGSSYTARLGMGDELIGLLQKRFGETKPILYRRMVGNSVPWQYLRGWARHLVIPDQPDVVIVYTIGKPEDLDKLLTELRENTTADIIVPSIHWRERGKPNWGRSEDAPDQKVADVRNVCEKHGAQFVENRAEWAEYLKANQLKIEDILSDAVHQSPFGAHIVNQNIARHFNPADEFSYDPLEREHRLTEEAGEFERLGNGFNVQFVGNRIDIIAWTRPDGGKLEATIDGEPASKADAFFMTYIEPARTNFQERRSPARDQSPHGVTLGVDIVPQTWTISMLDDEGNFELSGSVTGMDGKGNAFKEFVSDSGQILMNPAEWRRAERNKKGDQWTWNVVRSALSEVDLLGGRTEKVRITIAANLPNGEHHLELAPIGSGEIQVEGFDVFTPPLK